MAQNKVASDSKLVPRFMIPHAPQFKIKPRVLASILPLDPSPAHGLRQARTLWPILASKVCSFCFCLLKVVYIHAPLYLEPLAAHLNSKEEHKPTKAEALPTQVLKECLFPSRLAPRVTRILPTGLDPPSADDAIQPEFTNQLISNENS